MKQAPETLTFAVKGLNETGEIEGLGSVFGNVDHGGDIVDPKAFDNTLKAWAAKGRLPKMLWQHEPDEVIGIWEEMRVVEGGLYCKGRLLMDLPKAKEAYTLLKAGAIEGLSIGYATRDWEYEGDGRVRRLKELDLWEVSVVTFPMNEAAGVTGIKSVASERDLERAFMRDAGLSAKQAKAAVAAYKSLIERDADQHAARDAGDEAEVMRRKRALQSLVMELQSLKGVYRND